MKKYVEIYEYYKERITAGQLQNGEALPSVRKACALFSVSKTTVQSAYFELMADGLIISKEKSGYYVSGFTSKEEGANHSVTQTITPVFDLKSGTADKNSFDFALWQRYIKSALRQHERLLTYSDAQGEADLREALSAYIRQKRNIIASPDRIVVASGVQPLLNILCSLLNEKLTVSFPDESFVQGIGLFRAYGHTVKTRYKDADMIYVSPSHMTSYGDVMPMKRRLELVGYAAARHSHIIEDDFDADFLYHTKPTPSIFALSGADNVIYMGSFSNVLVPGIRISFMVLTKALSRRFHEQKQLFAQTASKTEQIALCQYLRDGHIYSQTRRIRRLYTGKVKQLLKEVEREIPTARASLSENAIQVRLVAPFYGDEKAFGREQLSVTIKDYKNGFIHLVLSPTGIDSDDIPVIVQHLKKALKSE